MACNLDAIIIGGGGLPDLFKGSPHEHLPNRCLIPVLGETMVTHTIRGIREVRGLGRVALIGPPLLRQQSFAPLVDALLDEGRDETENIMRGIEALPGADRILMVSADTPLVHRDSLEGFLALCPHDADVCYPVVEKACIDKHFPTRKWVFVKLREGRFTGSSLFIFRASVLLRQIDRLRAVMDARRDVLALVRMWGIGIFAKYLLGILSIPDLEKRISSLLGFRGAGVAAQYPELAMDIDKPSDIPLVEEKLAHRRHDS